MPLGTTKIGCRPPSPTPSPTSVAVAMAFPEAGAVPLQGLPSGPLGIMAGRHGGEGFAEHLHNLSPTCPISHTLHKNFIEVDPHGAAVPIPVFMETSPPDGIPAPAGSLRLCLKPASRFPNPARQMPALDGESWSAACLLRCRGLAMVVRAQGTRPGGENTLLLRLAGPGSSRRRASRSQCPMSSSLGLGSRAT